MRVMGCTAFEVLAHFEVLETSGVGMMAAVVKVLFVGLAAVTLATHRVEVDDVSRRVDGLKNVAD